MPVKATTLAAALGSAARHKATGSVVSRVQGVERRIWLRDGKVVFAESADAAEGFATILAFRGILLEKERMAIAAVAQPGLREDLAIAASGILGPVEVMEHARVVLEERLIAAFAIPGAVWQSEGQAPPEDLPSVGLPLTKVVLDGVRSHLAKDRLKVEFPVGGTDIYGFRSAALAAMPEASLTKDELRLTSVLDGKRNWDAAVVESKLDAPVAHAALYALALLGIAEYVTPGAQTPVEDVTVASAPAAPSVPGGGKLLAAGRAVEMRERLLMEVPELLEIPPEAAPEVVEDAFRALVARYDLGRAHFLADADRDAAISLLDRAIDAYLVLTDPPSRKKYLAAPKWDRDVVAASLAAKLTGEKGYVKAGIFLQAGNYLAAEAALLPALQASPRESRYHLRQGIAIYLRAKARGVAVAPAGAVRSLQKAIALDSTCDEGFLYLGHIAAAAGDKYGAKTYYETALTLNPGSGEAKRALMRLESS